jgi:hypothetical protein
VRDMTEDTGRTQMRWNEGKYAINREEEEGTREWREVGRVYSMAKYGSFDSVIPMGALV